MFFVCFLHIHKAFWLFLTPTLSSTPFPYLFPADPFLLYEFSLSYDPLTFTMSVCVTRGMTVSNGAWWAYHCMHIWRHWLFPPWNPLVAVRSAGNVEPHELHPHSLVATDRSYSCTRSLQTTEATWVNNQSGWVISIRQCYVALTLIFQPLLSFFYLYDISWS